VFWVFHCWHDKLWARFQRAHDRFDATGANPVHYQPADAYAPGGSPPLGHHLRDAMWPWDGTRGFVFPNDPGSRRPAQNDFAPLTSPFPDLGPPDPRKVTPATMVDYQGLGGPTNTGVAYDDTPFGAAPVAQPVRVGPADTSAVALRLAVLADRNASPATRAAAARHPDVALADGAAATARETARDAGAPAEVRAAALDLLAAASPADAAAEAAALARDRAQGADVTLAAANVLARIAASEGSAPAMDAAHEGLRAVLASPPDQATEAVALRVLASAGDPAAAPTLRALADGSRPPLLPNDELIELLRRYPENVAFVRRQLDSPDLRSQGAALRVLGGDPATVERRSAVALDPQRPRAVRLAALEGLGGDAPEVARTLAAVAADAQAPVAVRSRAAASVRVVVTRSGAPLPGPLADELAGRLRPLAGPGSPPALARAAERALAAVERARHR
jgi:hypothetical protein